MDNKGLIPPGLGYLAENIRTRDNILGASKEEGAKWAKNLGLPKQSETVFFAGCGYQFSSKLEAAMGLIRKMDKTPIGTDVAIGLAGFQRKLGMESLMFRVIGGGDTEEGEPLKAAIKVLNRLGINPGYLAEEEPCCGGLLHYVGAEKEYTQRARQVISKLTSRGIKNIISIVPSCTYSLKNTFEKLEMESSIKVDHFCEVVARNINSLHLHFPRSVKVTYHDPCQLVRYLGLVDEPRQILHSITGIEFVEPQWTKGQWATCCGGGGGFEAVFPEMSEMLAVNRTKELLETGARIIVTHCPGCIMQLETGLKALKAENIKVLDLAQIVATSLEDK